MLTSSNRSLCEAVNESNQTFPKQEKNSFWFTKVVLIILIMILATLGNLMVLVVTWMERSLHQPNKYFVACLASADLLIGVLFCPLLLYEFIHDGGISSIHVCRFFIAINIFAEAASINTLILISFDRYLKISKPLRYKSIMTTSKSLVMISIIWFISAAYVIFGMFSYNGSRGIYISSCGCLNDNSVFFTFCAVFAFFLPTIVIIIIYVRILVIAHRRRKRSRKGQLPQTNQVESQLATFYQDLKNIRLMAMVVGAFILCWGPFFIVKMFHMYNSGLLDFVFRSTVVTVLEEKILPIINSVCNPIIYACFDEKYREAFKRMFRRIMQS